MTSYNYAEAFSEMTNPRVSGTAKGLLAIVCICLALPAAADQRRNQVIAVVEGGPVTEADLKSQGQILQLEQQLYQGRLQALEEVIAWRLMEDAARKRGMTTEEFLKEEVDSKIPEPTPAEVDAYYLAQRKTLNKPFEAVRQQLTRELRAVRVADARNAFAAKLRDEASVTILLDPPRFDVEVGDAPRRGPVDAAVTIVEFSDYQCPYCKDVQPTLKKVLARYGDQVSLVFKDLPLVMHPEAKRAAQAARCAGDQGRYWEFHDELFRQSMLSEESYSQISKSLSLRQSEFQTCLNSGKYGDKVQSDYVQAMALGAVSPPSFFVNGVFVRGVRTFDQFVAMIDAELTRMKKGAEEVQKTR